MVGTPYENSAVYRVDVAMNEFKISHKRSGASLLTPVARHLGAHLHAYYFSAKTSLGLTDSPPISCDREKGESVGW